MASRLLAAFSKICDFILGFLSKLKVFYLILVVIGIMVFFLVIEAFISVSTIDSMFQVTQQVFQDSTRNLVAIASVKQELETVRKDYVMNIAKISPIEPSISNLSVAIQSLEKIDSSVIADLEKDIAGVDEILKRPITPENYEELDRSLSFINMRFQTLQTKANRKATDVMDYGRNYSDHSKVGAGVILALSIFISVGFGVLIAASISRPLKVMVNAANALEQGDLTKELRADGCYEAAEAVRSLNNAILHLRAVVGGVNEQSLALASCSKELQEAAQDSGKSSSEVARAMVELAGGAVEQTNQINQAVSIVTQLAELVRQVSIETERISEASAKVVKYSQAGQAVTGNVVEEINALYGSTIEVGQVIAEVNQSSEEIAKMTSMIQGIAEQTTLLALNAAIEAARAGEYGKGFSVVAQETGILAEQSKQAAKLIDKQVSQMKKRANHAVEVIQKGIIRVEEGKNLTSEAKATFEGIFRLLGEMLLQIETVANSAKGMAQKNETMINAVGSIASISEESMASTEEVSATAEEQCANAQEVTAQAESLSRVAEQLKNSITIFKI